VLHENDVLSLARFIACMDDAFMIKSIEMPGQMPSRPTPLLLAQWHAFPEDDRPF